MYFWPYKTYGMANNLDVRLLIYIPIFSKISRYNIRKNPNFSNLYRYNKILNFEGLYRIDICNFIDLYKYNHSSFSNYVFFKRDAKLFLLRVTASVNLEKKRPACCFCKLLSSMWRGFTLISRYRCKYHKSRYLFIWYS